MIKDKKVYAIILAREGSKRLSGKCLKEIDGKTLIDIAIDKAKSSKYIDEVYLSTSSSKYKDMFKDKCGIIDRPQELSEDNVPNLPVYKHAVSMLDMASHDYLIHIDLCKPLSRADQINQVIECASIDDLDSCFTTKRLHNSLVGDEGVVSQEKVDRYMHFNLCRLFNKKTIEASSLGTWGAGDNHENISIVEDWQVDIDTQEDLYIARMLYHSMKNT